MSQSQDVRFSKNPCRAVIEPSESLTWPDRRGAGLISRLLLSEVSKTPVELLGGRIRFERLMPQFQRSQHLALLLCRRSLTA